MATMQSICDLCRLDLNDAEKTRYSDDELLKFANDGIARAYVIRPDLKFGNYTQAYSDLGLTEDFPLPLEYRDPIASYMTARSETADDEYAIEQRAVQGLKMFLNGMGVG